MTHIAAPYPHAGSRRFGVSGAFPDVRYLGIEGKSRKWAKQTLSHAKLKAPASHKAATYYDRNRPIPTSRHLAPWKLKLKEDACLQNEKIAIRAETIERHMDARALA
ncbi:hypothetical protein AcW1_005260 [Taiwanofungus camphoratus]|nr:hypothetical protein AcW2_004030 [Antrodia cinnamomea]KAI0933435.1 hypothetical protein AcV5_005582 [Antrodia cinnamomea]KAI0948770.1 hypothetical protein AcV7_009424 [Antrodia cinnamomea]KAI0956625.1 hypothetical protein AcW1_005260 [Antrodia cinnamomea]